MVCCACDDSESPNGNAVVLQLEDSVAEVAEVDVLQEKCLSLPVVSKMSEASAASTNPLPFLSQDLDSRYRHSQVGQIVSSKVPNVSKVDESLSTTMNNCCEPLSTILKHLSFLTQAFTSGGRDLHVVMRQLKHLSPHKDTWFVDGEFIGLLTYMGFIALDIFGLRIFHGSLECFADLLTQLVETFLAALVIGHHPPEQNDLKNLKA